MASSPEFDALVTCLLVQERAPVAGLVARVRELAVKASESLPPVQVLYNTCHGGFGFSEAFERFRPAIEGSHHGLHHERTCDPDAHGTLKRFARAMLARFPAFDRHMRAFHKYRLGEVTRAVVNLEERVRERPDMVRKVAYIERLLAGEREPPELPLKIPEGIERVIGFCANGYFDHFDDAQLREILVLVRAHIARTDADQYGSEYADDLEPEAFRLYTLFRKEEQERDAQQKAERKARYGMFASLHSKNDEDDPDAERLSFADRLGECRWNWSTQRFFHKADMDFTAWLLRSEPAWLDVNDYDLEGQRFDYSPGFLQKDRMRDQDALEYVGRMLASGTYCRLAVADVPALSDWRIGDYDGLESVTWE